MARRTKPARIVLTVDPGNACGAALSVVSEVVFKWEVKQSIREISRILNRVKVIERSTNQKAIVIVENQYMNMGGIGKNGKVRKPNPKAMATLYKRRHEWEIVAELLGLETDTVYPASWQTVLKLSGITGTTKEKSIALAKIRWPNFVCTHDSADALCMNFWYTGIQANEWNL